MTAKDAQRILAVVAILAAGTAQAADFYARTAGAAPITTNWNQNTTWTASATCNGAATAGFPGAGDNVFICPGKTVNVNVASAAAAVTFMTAGAASSLVHGAGMALTVGAGGMTINGSSNTNGTRLWNIGSGTGTVNGPVTLVEGSTNARIANITLSTGTLDINGNLAMTNANNNARTVIVATGAANVFVSGNFTLSNTFGTLTPGAASNFRYDTAAAAAVATGGAIQYRNLFINKAGGIATTTALPAPTRTLTVLGTLNVQAGTFDITGVNATVTGLTTVSATGTLRFNTSTTGTKTFGAVTLTAGAPAGIWNNAINEDITLTGTFTNNGTFTAGTGIYTFSGAAAQLIAGAVASTFQSVTINKTAAANTVTVNAGTPSPTVNGTLTLTMGRLVTSGAACPAAQPIIVGATGTTAGGSVNSYVQGTLRKNFAAGATLDFRAGAQDEFPVGNGALYLPIEISGGGTSTAGNLAVCVVATDHPQVTAPVSTTGIDATRSVNRYWSLTNTTLNTASGVGAALLDATFKFANAGDVDAIATPANFIVERWNGAIWSPTTRVAAAATSTRAQNIDLTAGTNHIAIGEPLAGFTALPGQFNAFDTTTTAGAVIGKIQTKVAATAFTVRLVRLNAAKNAIDTAYAQAGVTVELYDSSNNSGALNAVTGCRATWSPIAGTSQSVNFAAGIVNATFTIAMLPNVYRDVRVHVVKAGAGAGEGCSTDPFAIRPQNLTTSARDADWQTAGTARLLNNTVATGGNVHKASTAAAVTPRPFTLRATPAPATATNYNGNPTTVAGFPACIAPPAACVTGALSYTAGSWVNGAIAGTRENSTANYSEAGVFNLRLEDRTYADVDLVDGSSVATRTVPAAATASVGRFVPDRFEITAVTAPVFRTFNTNDPACSAAASPPKRTFTYIGQRFGYFTLPVAMVTAKEAGGGTTRNYTGTLWKLTNASVSQSFANSPVMPLDLAGVGAPALNETAGTGTGTYTANAADAIAFTRDNATPQPPFNADLSLTVSVADAAEAGAGQGTITTSPPFAFSTIAYDSGNAFRYGRLRLSNANGSQLVPLAVPVETQYFTGPPMNAFVTNAADHCTTLSATNVTMGNFQGNLAPLASCKTNMNAAIAFTTGRGNLQLSAPGSANNGSVDLTVQLGSGAFGSNSCVGALSPPPQATTGANLLYLQGNWTGGPYTQNPTSRATFGVFKGADEVIFIRENF